MFAYVPASHDFFSPFVQYEPVVERIFLDYQIGNVRSSFMLSENNVVLKNSYLVQSKWIHQKAPGSYKSWLPNYA